MNREEIKKAYSRIGMAYAVFILVMYVASFIITLAVKRAGIEVGSWLRYLIGMGPIWLCGFPACYLLIKGMYHICPDEHSISFGYGIKFYFMLCFMMISGNIIGRLVAYLVKLTTGIAIDNTTIDMIGNQDLLPGFIFVVILGPILEELAFRKILIDRLWFFSKKYTIFLSGIMFALFHTNIYQFFYAFFVGTLFAYIYTITGRIRYSIMLHMFINFMHGILPLIFIKMMDVELITRLVVLSADSKEAQELAMKLLVSPGFILFILYCLMILGFVITGIVLFVKNIKKMRVDDTMSPLQKPGALSVVYKNIGMITFILTIIAFSIYEIAAS